MEFIPEVFLEKKSESYHPRMRTRTLSDYNGLLFGHLFDIESGDTSIDVFLDTYCGCSIKTLEELINNRFDFKKSPVVWTEMGGGGAIAMRQLMSLPGMREKLITYNVDLSDFDDKSIKDVRVLREISKESPRALRKENKPELIRKDMENVVLLKNPDLITSVSSVYYANNPLMTICNWYNQLSDGGLLVIASEQRWTDRIKNDGDVYFSDVGPVTKFVKQIESNGINVATGGNLRDFTGARKFNSMLIEKKSNTSLRLNTELSRVSVDDNGFNVVFYKKNDSVVLCS